MPEKPLVPYKSLKQKQKARIADWMYRETLRFFLEHQRMPEAEEFESLCQAVYAKVQSSNYRVVYEEIQQLYAKRLDAYTLRVKRDVEAGITMESLTKQPKQKKTGKSPRPRKKKNCEPTAMEPWQDDRFFFLAEKYTVKITQQAQEQIREIVSYIRFTLQAPETAMKMLDTLQEEIASLDQFPNRVPLTEEEPWHSQGIHKFPVKNYLIYFWVDEEIKKVQIIGAVYGRKDQRHQLSNLDMF